MGILPDEVISESRTERSGDVDETAHSKPDSDFEQISRVLNVDFLQSLAVEVIQTPGAMDDLRNSPCGKVIDGPGNRRENSVEIHSVRLDARRNQFRPNGG
jgi:hypothetical protein